MDTFNGSDATRTRDVRRDRLAFTRERGRSNSDGSTTAVKRCAGVKVNARGINFNKHVTGDNLIVMLPSSYCGTSATRARDPVG
jgi:hypothetical protein